MTPLRRAIAALSVLAALLVAAPQAAAQQPTVNAPSAIVVDAATGEVLFEKNPDDERSIASTTKLMTALLTLERTKPSDVFRAARYDAGPIESKINLRPRERMRVQDLLVALLLESANDAAATLAEGISESRSAFVDEMNVRAAELGLTGTSYANPIGFDDPDNHSTASDLAKLARVLLRNERFADIVDRPRAALRSGARRRVVDNRNDLVRTHEFVDGVKTGHTRQAGYVLVGSASRTGASVVSVVMGEPSETARDVESLELLRYGLGRFVRVTPVRPGRTLTRVAVRHFDDRRVALETRRPVTLTVRRGARVRTRFDVPEELEGPMPAGRRVGTAEIVVRGRVAARVPLVTATSVPEADLTERVGGGFGWAIAFLVVAAAVFGGVRLRRGRGVRA